MVYPFYARNGMRGSTICVSAGVWLGRANADREVRENRRRETFLWPLASLCNAPDLRELRVPLGKDTQERLIVHQQCSQGHKWHVAFTELHKPTGNTDTVMGDCRL